MATLPLRLERINNNYFLAITVSLLVALFVVPLFGLDIAYKIIGLANDASQWIVAFWVINNVVSGSSYLGTFLDYLTNNRTIFDIFFRRNYPRDQRKINYENRLTSLGVVIIAPLLIVILYLGGELGVTESIGLAIALFSMRLIGVAGGCGTRMGRVVDGFWNISIEDTRCFGFICIPTYGLFILVTALVGTFVLVAFATPVTLTECALGFVYLSNIVSGASYLGRILDFARVGFGDPLQTNMWRRYWESILTLAGIIFSIVVGYVCVPLTMIKVIQSLPVSMIVVANIFTTMGVFGGLCNRIGKVIDRWTSPLRGEETLLPLSAIRPSVADEDDDTDNDDDSWNAKPQEMRSLLSTGNNQLKEWRRSSDSQKLNGIETSSGGASTLPQHFPSLLTPPPRTVSATAAHVESHTSGDRLITTRSTL